MWQQFSLVGMHLNLQILGWCVYALWLLLLISFTYCFFKSLQPDTVTEFETLSPTGETVVEVRIHSNIIDLVVTIMMVHVVGKSSVLCTSTCCQFRSIIK